MCLFSCLTKNSETKQIIKKGNEWWIWNETYLYFSWKTQYGIEGNKRISPALEKWIEQERMSLKEGRARQNLLQIILLPGILDRVYQNDVLILWLTLNISVVYGWFLFLQGKLQFRLVWFRTIRLSKPS